MLGLSSYYVQLQEMFEWFRISTITGDWKTEKHYVVVVSIARVNDAHRGVEPI